MSRMWDGRHQHRRRRQPPTPTSERPRDTNANASANTSKLGLSGPVRACLGRSWLVWARVVWARVVALGSRGRSGLAWSGLVWSVWARVVLARVVFWAFLGQSGLVRTFWTIWAGLGHLGFDGAKGDVLKPYHI